MVCVVQLRIHVFVPQTVETRLDERREPELALEGGAHGVARQEIGVGHVLGRLVHQLEVDGLRHRAVRCVDELAKRECMYVLVRIDKHIPRERYVQFGKLQGMRLADGLLGGVEHARVLDDTRNHARDLRLRTAIGGDDGAGHALRQSLQALLYGTLLVP